MLYPLLVYVTMQEPFARVGRSVLDEAIQVMAVATVREVAEKDPLVCYLDMS